ncbi:MAG: hypothetical protein ACI9SE_002100, partial [Neolewinella sp.]
MLWAFGGDVLTCPRCGGWALSRRLLRSESLDIVGQERLRTLALLGLEPKQLNHSMTRMLAADCGVGSITASVTFGKTSWRKLQSAL